MNDLLTVSICIGNACQLKGSLQVIERFQELVLDHKLQDFVQIEREHFCMGHCRRGTTARLSDGYVTDINLLNIEEKFQECVLDRLNPNVPG
jgi:NADH:ubiquinone oxidoreductase subunit E